MKYILKSGILYDESNHVVAKLKNVFTGPEKRIFSNDDTLIMTANIIESNLPHLKNADVRSRTYLLTDINKNHIATAKPDYATGNDPEIIGWPAYSVPRADHAVLEIYGNSYVLVMHNSQNYVLHNETGDAVMHIIHRGITGGWILDTRENFSPEILCGIFTFCRYIELENDLLII